MFSLVFAALFALAFAEPITDTQFVDDWCLLIGTCVNQANYCNGAPTIPAKFITCESGNIVELVYESPGQNTIPLSIGNLADLRELTINVVSSFGFYTIPPEIGFLGDTLQALRITGDGTGALNPLPGQIGLLVNVRLFEISDVNFPPGSQFPPSIGAMTGLREFQMFRVAYENEFPETFAQNWNSIEIVHFSLISGTSGKMPPFGNKPLLRLYQIFLFADPIEFDDNEIFFSPNLEAFSIFLSLQASGEISPLVYQATNLKALQLIACGSIEFELTPEIGSLVDLRQLELTIDESITGTLPSTVGDLTSLRTLSLSGTKVGGSLPTEIGRLSELVTVLMGERFAVGLFTPPVAFNAVAECPTLPANETLTGVVPQELIDLLFLGNLDTIRLQDSCFGGEIPAPSDTPLRLLNADFLYELDFSNSLFTGSLPRWLTEFARFDDADGSDDDDSNFCDLSGNLFCFKPKPYTVAELECPFALNGALDECGICEGDNSACTDCMGVLHGPAREDLCGVCNGSNECLDCAGTPTGLSEYDACDVCRGDNTTCMADCTGTPHGSLEVDECGVCGGNSTCVDCGGVPFGTLAVDACGVCGGTNSTCYDCEGTIGGTKIVDDCGECVDAKAADYTPKCYDCLGVANGTAVRDLCGNCPASSDCKIESLALTHVLAKGYAWLFGAAAALALLALILACASGLFGSLVAN